MSAESKSAEPNDKSKPQPPSAEAARHVSEAHQLLKAMRESLDRYPELDQAILKLEMALDALTLQTGGML